MKTILSVENEILSHLDPLSATVAFRNLLWCEARRTGLSPHKVVISLQTNVSDGGIDARVDSLPEVDSVLLKGTSYFQVKAGQTFKPWYKSHLVRELFGNAREKPGKKGLAPGITECMEERGQYVIVSFGHDLTPVQHSKSNSILKGLLAECGYHAPRADVLGQGQIAAMIESYPSLALGLLDRSGLPFLTFDSWKSKDDMLPPLHLAEAQSEFINDIRETLRGGVHQHVRITGEPGIGKTRLVLEALQPDDLSHLVVYVPHAEVFQEGQFFNELLRTDIGYFATLVIDECMESQMMSIWGALKGRKKLRLVTIDHNPERNRDSDMRHLECPRLPDKEIEEIIASYIGKQISLSRTGHPGARGRREWPMLSARTCAVVRRTF